MDPTTDFEAAIDAMPSDMPQDSPQQAAPVVAVAPAPASEPAPATVAPVATPAPVNVGDEDLEALRGKPKQAATPAATASPEPPKPAAEPSSLKEFRTVYETTKKERDTLAADLAKLRTEAAEARKAGEKDAEARVRAELEVVVKEKTELDSRIRFLDYSKSPEFQAKHEKPIKDAWRAAIEDLNGATIINDDGTESEANYGHIQALMRMPPIEAARTAAKWFGPASSEVMRHRSTILALGKEKDAAIEHWKTKGEELTAQSQREAEEFNGSLHSLFNSERDSFPTNYPELFGHDPKNDEEADLVRKNRALTEMAVRGKGIPEGTDARQRSELMVKAQARMVARAEAFGFTRLRLNKAVDEIETLKKKLAEFEGSVPGEGKTTPPAPGKADSDVSDWERAIDNAPAYV